MLSNKLITGVFLFFTFFKGLGQVQSSDIIIGVYLPGDEESVNEEEAEKKNKEMSLPEVHFFYNQTAKRILSNKLFQALTENGIASRGNEFYPQFILLPRMSLVDERILPTAPPKIVVKMDLTLHLGNGYQGNRFKTFSTLLVGVGNNRYSAYMNAMNKLNPRGDEIQAFLEAGKNKIIEYFDTSCENIIGTAINLQKQQMYSSAWRLLASIPTSASCYPESEPHLIEVYRQSQNTTCLRLLSLAKSLWAGSHSLEAAKKATEELSKINPNSPCYPEVEELYEKITVEVKSEKESDRDFLYKLMDLSSKTEIEVARSQGQILVLEGKQKPQYDLVRVMDW